MTQRKKLTAVPSSKKSRNIPFLRLSLSFLVVSASLLFFYFKTGLQPVDPNGQPRPFVINQGENLSIIATRLEKNNLIKNRFAFIFLTYNKGFQTRLQAGSFTLSSAFAPHQILTTLTTGRQDYWLKITEGWRLEQIKLYLQDLGFTKQETALLAKEKEGVFFPDSYLIPKDYTMQNILPIIDKNYQQKLNEAQKNTTTTLTAHQALILASIIEREARTAKSKQQISGVLHNRLDIGMALQVDATVQYATDSQTIPKKYWQPITRSDLSIVSPFNTYQHPGLPPFPICNPGFDSLHAAFHPIPSLHLYYITGNDNLMHYATTLEGHNANISKYL